MGSDSTAVEEKWTGTTNEVGIARGSERDIVRIADGLPMGIFAEGISELQQCVLSFSQMELG